MVSERDASGQPLGWGMLLAARIVLLTWCLPQTLVGGVIALALARRCEHERFRAAIVTHWPLTSGLSMGMFVFVPRACPQSLILHEYGHTLQSLILGPFYPLVILVPSLVWAGLPRLERFRTRRSYSYYRFFTERWANLLVHRRTGREPAGWY